MFDDFEKDLDLPPIFVYGGDCRCSKRQVISQKHASMFHYTHFEAAIYDWHMALSIASRAYVLETGRIILTGKGQELLCDPRVREAYLGC